MNPPNLYDDDESWKRFLLTATDKELDDLCKNIHRVSVLVTELARDSIE